jgi:NAD(P)-dependent dehydrogenase (short-subunit alcohol dehydrogenase family)
MTGPLQDQTVPVIGQGDGIARAVALAARDAAAQVVAAGRDQRTLDLVSFEPDKVSVQPGDTQLRLEPGRTVLPHGADRDLTVDEAVADKQP